MHESHKEIKRDVIKRDEPEAPPPVSMECAQYWQLGNAQWRTACCVCGCGWVGGVGMRRGGGGARGPNATRSSSARGE